MAARGWRTSLSQRVRLGLVARHLATKEAEGGKGPDVEVYLIDDDEMMGYKSRERESGHEDRPALMVTEASGRRRGGTVSSIETSSANQHRPLPLSPLHTRSLARHDSFNLRPQPYPHVDHHP